MTAPAADTSIGYTLIGKPRVITLTRPANIQGTQPAITINVPNCHESEANQDDFNKYEFLLNGVWKKFTVWNTEITPYNPGNGWLATDDLGDIYEIHHRELKSRRERYVLFGKRRGS